MCDPKLTIPCQHTQVREGPLLITNSTTDGMSEDEILARTDEDNRDDLDEEGYPVNDATQK